MQIEVDDPYLHEVSMVYVVCYKMLGSTTAEASRPW